MIPFYDDPNGGGGQAPQPVQQPQQGGLAKLRRSPMGKGISAGLGQFGQSMGGGGVRQQMPPQGPQMGAPPQMGQMRPPMQPPSPALSVDQLAPQGLAPAPTPMQSGYADEANKPGALGPTVPPQQSGLDKLRGSRAGKGLAAGLSQFGANMGGTGYKGPQFY